MPRACARFFAWCEQRGLTLAAIRPFDVAAWVNELQEKQGRRGEAAARRRAHAVRLADHRSTVPNGAG